jgi:hypothetical protein
LFADADMCFGAQTGRATDRLPPPHVGRRSMVF